MSMKGEKYKSKAAMMKHEKSEGSKERKMEYGKKVKGAIIQGKESRAAYGTARTNALGLRKQTQTSANKKSAATTYKAATSSLKDKKVPSSARGMVQNVRAKAAGTLSVINARNTKKVSGPKSKRGN